MQVGIAVPTLILKPLGKANNCLVQKNVAEQKQVTRKNVLPCYHDYYDMFPANFHSAENVAKLPWLYRVDELTT